MRLIDKVAAMPKRVKFWALLPNEPAWAQFRLIRIVVGGW